MEEMTASEILRRNADDWTVHCPRLPIDFCPKCERDLRGDDND